MISVRFAFVNDMGVLGHNDPVDIDHLPTIGTMVTCNEIPPAVVLHVFEERPPQEVLDFVLMYRAHGWDGLPLIICQTPDGWDPMKSHEHHTLQ